MQTRLLERFLRYVAVTSQSDASQAVVPSTDCLLYTSPSPRDRG